MVLITRQLKFIFNLWDDINIYHITILFMNIFTLFVYKDHTLQHFPLHICMCVGKIMHQKLQQKSTRHLINKNYILTSLSLLPNCIFKFGIALKIATSDCIVLL